MKRLLVFLVLLLTGCGTLRVPPTPTPTHIPIDATATLDFRPPTERPANAFSENDISGGGWNPTAAAFAPDTEVLPGMTAVPDEFRPQLVTIPLSDNTQLAAELYQNLDERRPGVLLIADQVEGWQNFPVLLYQSGYTVLSVQTRIPVLVGDFTAMMETLLGLPTVNAGAVGVIGAGVGADAALLGCADDARCATAILLSPQQQDVLVTAVANYNPRPLLLVASQDDPGALQVGEAIRVQARGEVLFQTFEIGGEGTAMLFNRPDLGTLMIQWLDRYVPQQAAP